MARDTESPSESSGDQAVTDMITGAAAIAEFLGESLPATSNTFIGTNSD